MEQLATNQHPPQLPSTNVTQSSGPQVNPDTLATGESCGPLSNTVTHSCLGGAADPPPRCMNRPVRRRRRSLALETTTAATPALPPTAPGTHTTRHRRRCHPTCPGSPLRPANTTGPLPARAPVHRRRSPKARAAWGPGAPGGRPLARPWADGDRRPLGRPGAAGPTPARRQAARLRRRSSGPPAPGQPLLLFPEAPPARARGPPVPAPPPARASARRTRPPPSPAPPPPRPAPPAPPVGRPCAQVRRRRFARTTLIPSPVWQ